MDIGKFELLCPEAFEVNKVGHVISPTLRQIRSVTYSVYNMFITILLLDVKTFFEKIDITNKEWYISLSKEEKMNLSLYDCIIGNDNVLLTVVDIFNFFFTEYVVFNKNEGCFLLYKHEPDVQDNHECVGIINRENYIDICELILKRVCIERDDPICKETKYKNALAKRLMEKIQSSNNKENGNTDKRQNVENIISKVCVRHNSINLINVWDLTIYQLHDTFKSMQINNIYDIGLTRMSVWGDEKGSFDSLSWLGNQIN